MRKWNFCAGPAVISEEVLEEVENEGVDPDEGVRMSLNTKEVIEKADLHLIKVKIQEVLKILAEFSKQREEGKPRYEYVDDLKELFCNYYGYSTDVMELFMSLFSPHECQQFLEANEDQRPLTIRCNTLRTKRKDLAQALMQRGVQVEPVGDWSKVGIKINETKVPTLDRYAQYNKTENPVSASKTTRTLTKPTQIGVT